MLYKMKYQLLFVPFLLFLSCGGDDGSGGGSSSGSEYLNVVDLDIPGGNTTATLSVQASNNCEWNITWSDSWILNITPSKGRGVQNVLLTVEQNPSSANLRTAIVTVSNSNRSIVRTITVKQSANAERLQVSGLIDGKLTFPSMGTEYKITVSSNTHWTVKNIPSWLQVSPSEGRNDSEVSVKADANQTKDVLTGTLLFNGDGGASVEVSVSQEVASQPTVTSPQLIAVDKTEATVTFTYTSELPVTTYGLCYDTKENPDLQTSPYESRIGSESNGEANISLRKLTSNTTYYVRAYATSSVGTQYSDCVSFTTKSGTPDIGDNTKPTLIKSKD